MTKISKNIKRLRSERGLTQDNLAEKIHITRQAVSSWENDRTQPDVEMLQRLSDVLEVSLEELIYGKKRNTSLETEKPNYNNTLIIVFSILGALLVGVGVVLIFVTFWQEMSMFWKGAMSFIPLLAGQGAGVFVLLKKKDQIPWCEGGSVLWSAGIGATLTLIYNIFDLSINWQDILMLIALSALPIILLLKSVSPLIFYYAFSITWGISFWDNKAIPRYAYIIVTYVLIAIGCAFSAYMLKTEKKSHRSVYSMWISVIAVAVSATMTGLGLGDCVPLCIVGLGSVAICLYILSFKDGDMAMPYKIPGLLIISLCMFIASTMFLFDGFEPEMPQKIFVAACVIAITVSAAYTKLKNADGAALAFLALSILSMGVYTAMAFNFERHSWNESELSPYFIIIKIIALAANIVMMISGGRERKLIPINIGFVGVAALVMLTVAQSGLSLLGNGFILLVFGGVLLTINFKLARAKQKTPAIENNEEVQSDEK